MTYINKIAPFTESHQKVVWLYVPVNEVFIMNEFDPRQLKK